MAKKKSKKRSSPEKKPQRVEALPKRRRLRRPSRLTWVLLAAGAAGSLALILSLLFLLHRSPNRVRRDGKLNVLLITLDTTRADRLGCYGYSGAATPNLDRLSNRGVRFANATCSAPLTLPSHCSILTGTTPLYHQVHNNGLYRLDGAALTMAEALHAKGLATAAFVSSFSIDSRYGLDQGFDLYDDNFMAGQTFKALNSERKADATFAAFSTWFERSGDRQFFCWVHFFDPHFPYDPPSPYKERWFNSPYDGEIALVDEYVGRIVGALEEKGLLDRTLIVVAGDHGEAFGEKGEYGHGLFLYDSTLKVPLIFFAPGHLPAGRVVESRVRLIDVMPTALDLLGEPKVMSIQGVSLLPYLDGKDGPDLDAYIETYYPRENYGWSELTGLVVDGWKFIRAPREELYDLERDPAEEKDLAVKEERHRKNLRVRLLQLIKSMPTPIRGSSKRLTAEEERRLATLGYISPHAAEPQREGPLPDPKEKIAEYGLIHQADMDEMLGKLPEAESLYRQMISRAPDVPGHYVNCALVLAEQKKFGEAIELLAQASRRIPDSVLLHERLGLIHLAVNQWPESLAAMDRALRLDPRNFNALLTTAWILDQMGKSAEAMAFYDRAREVEPENKFLRQNRALALSGLGRTPEAIAALEALTRDFPDDYEVWQNLGIAQGMGGQVERSIESLERAVALQSTPLAYFNLAVAYKSRGDIANAIRCLRLYLEHASGEDPLKVRSAERELQELEKQPSR